ncbi:hypothetical protein ACF0H5_010931 [Mactra antiquata]
MSEPFIIDPDAEESNIVDTETTSLIVDTCRDDDDTKPARPDDSSLSLPLSSDVKSVSNVSLAGSFMEPSSSSVTSPSATTLPQKPDHSPRQPAHYPDSPQSHASRKSAKMRRANAHQRPESPVSVSSRMSASSKKSGKKSAPHSTADRASRTSSINFSVHHGESLTNLPENYFNDDFHQPIQTVICPATVVTQPIQVDNKKPTRFIVSPAQSIPTSVRNIDNHTPKSESSYAQSMNQRHSPEPETQFYMSEMSLHQDSDKPSSIADPNRFVLTDVEEIMGVERKHDILDPTMNNVMDLDDVSSFMKDVEENQMTVMSNFSVNTQDSATYRHATLKCGNISFVKDSTELEYELKKHYLCVGYDTKMQEVTDFMARFWNMKNPNIVLSVISSCENFKPWKSQRLKDDFQKGILKAANTTNMWIVTNGIDAGIPKIIGDAVNEHNTELFSTKLFSHPLVSSTEQRRRRLTLIGIVPKDSVPYGTYFDGTEGVQVTNNGEKRNADIHELNPDHSHFIMVEDDEREISQGNLRCTIEQQFTRKIKKKKKLHRLMSIGSENIDDPTNIVEDIDEFIPVVGLLVQGSPKNIDQVLFYLQNKMPVVVLKGSGGIADMLSYVYEEVIEKSESDPDYVENFLKPELVKMIMRFYASYFEDNEMAKFVLRDKLIQCVNLAVDGDTGSESSFFTIINIKGWGSCMRDLDKYILRALFKYREHLGNLFHHSGERHEQKGTREQLQNDLQLTVDWNRPDLAWEIFQQDFTKVRIDKKMFEKALLQKDREDFIELFMSQGVKVHKFLNHKKLRLLFEKAEDREFFCNVCLEGVLGLSVLPHQPLGDDFLSENLNKLIYKLSWISNFIEPYELSMSATGMYTVNAPLAERKAINSLMIWAVLMNRHKLAKKLWNVCDQPIGLALICSRINRELSKYPMEQHVKTELEHNAKEFGEMALGALAICWRDSSVQAYLKLGERAPDFNNKSVIEIAHDAGYIHFLAHPCCQKWLTKKFHGHLHFKELNWGFFRLPLWFKILTSVFLIFPMFVWISFTPSNKNASDEEITQDLDQSDSEEEDDILPHVTKSTLETIMMKKKKKNPLSNTIKSVLQFRKPKRDVPLHQKFYLLWTAPITKFWMTQLFYFAYLGLFCLATLWPTCGNQIIDIILWGWTAVIEMELVCRVYKKYHKYKTLSLLGNCIDILLILIFLILLLMTRIMQTWVPLTDYLLAKTIMCYGLIYFFYRLLGVYLPISPTLGPMLLRISRMVKHDFVAFVRMFLIFMIAGGVTIQATVYPNWPMSTSLIKRVITRPIYGMFLTQIDDLEGNATCKGDYEQSRDYCHAGDVYTGSNPTYTDPRIQNISTCSVSSFSAYVVTLQYLLICKLVLVTLLFAMFALTIAKVDEMASDIWKFQRYSLIADFIERFSLPPPFTVISFVYLILKFIYEKCKRCEYNCSILCCPHKDKRVKSYKNKMSSLDTTVFWKKVAREYTATEEAKAENNSLASRQGDILISLQEDLRTHRKSMKRLNDRVMELERMMQSSRVYLEDIAHKLEKSDVMGITNVKGRFIHVAARQSPYPDTSLARFPVFDKYVPWEAPYDVYEPKTYTLSEDKFPESEIIYVDVDMIMLIKLKEERLALGSDDDGGLSPLPKFNPKWNAVTSYKVKGEKREIDRRSWINIDDQPLRYKLDSLGIPLNPMGRTGLRGKGNLWRWGPNHVIKAVVTRWRRKYGPDINTMADFLYVEGKRVLEFITVQKDTIMDSNYALPGDILHGLSNPSSILCRSFMSQVFDEQDCGQYNRFDQSEMIEFFAQFASTVVGGSISSFQPTSEASSLPRSGYVLQPHLSESRTNLRTETDQSGFSASLIYKGYLDDPRNTDNAWVEAEVWNFHYDIGDTFDLNIAEGLSVKWKEVSPYVKMFGNETVIVQEAARIQDAYH